jgi:hypothetical protein
VLPLLATAVWAVLSYVNMEHKCWFGYNHKVYYWVSEGPRLLIILVAGRGRDLFTVLRSTSSSWSTSCACCTPR